MLMLEPEWPTLPSRAPNLDGSSPVVIYLYVEDVDSTVERALKRGGKQASERKNAGIAPPAVVVAEAGGEFQSVDHAFRSSHQTPDTNCERGG